MSETTQGFRHFDLPVDHIEVGETPEEDKDLGNWVPPQSHVHEDIEIFKKKPGLVMARKQHTGTMVEARVMGLSKDRELPDAFYKLLGGATFNSAFYEHGNGASDVMRRRLWLPVPNELRREVDTEYMNEQEREQLAHNIKKVARERMTELARQQLLSAAEKTGLKAAMTEFTRAGKDPQVRKSIGRRLGNASLTIGTIPKAEKIANAWDEEHQQEIVRNGAIDVRKASLSLARHLGVYPSIAQLADARSPLVNHVANERGKYSTAAIEIIEQAQEEVFDIEKRQRAA